MEQSNTTTLDVSLEREKIQIERERLALERERWETERESYRHTINLSNRAAGRLAIPVSTFALSIIVALLFGGAVGAYITTRELRSGTERFAASIANVLNQDTGFDATNDFGQVTSPLIRAVNRGGKSGGYLLILE